MTSISRILDHELARHRADVRTTQWSVSIGEIFSLYERKQLEINPAFQRFFRWSEIQKTYLVESVLLGLPIPPLFFAQSEGGTLEVVDGVQRLSTLLQLRGVLLEPARRQGGDETPRRAPLVLTRGQYLKSLEGLVWDEEVLSSLSAGLGVSGFLTEAQRSDILFSKLDATIIKRQSGEQAKYDVFRRLNSYGEALTQQEMRAALIASVNGDCLAWLSGLAQSDEVVELLSLSDRQLERQYDVELVLRFFYLVEHDDLRQSDLREFTAVLDEYGLELANEFPSDRARNLGDVFNKTMEMIASSVGSDFFRRFYADEGRFKGPFLNTSFEALASSLGYRLMRDLDVAPDLRTAAEAFWHRPEISTRFATGRSTEWRLSTYVPLGRELLAS